MISLGMTLTFMSDNILKLLLTTQDTMFMLGQFKKKIKYIYGMNLAKPNLGLPTPSWVSTFYTEHKMVLCFILNASNALQPVKFHRLNNQTQVCKPKLGFLS
jgi:hypothetical protein